MSKIDELRKRAAKLREDAKKLELQAKSEEEAAFTKLGNYAAKYLSGELTLDQFGEKALELEFEYNLGGGQ
jgi:hypothetical protein